MTNRKNVAGADCHLILEKAIAKRSPLTITTHQYDQWQVYKSNFIALGNNRLLLAPPVLDTHDGHMEPSQGQELAITFKQGYYKNIFTTRAIAQERYEIDPGIFMPVVAVMVPDQLEKIQRRAYTRALVPENERIPVTFQRVSSQSNKSAETWQGQLTDLSAGGLGVRIDRGKIASLSEGDQLELRFVPMANQNELLVHVRFRHASDSEQPDQALLGFQLIGQEMNEKGRNTLRRIGRVVHLYQRQRELSKHPNLSVH
jgi:c-di-GMP-binding flagellar brake protein YcgR